MPRKNNDQVSLYCEETNAETNAGLVMRIYRIVPQMHSAVLSTLYMCKKTAIEILLRKARVLFTECVENMYPPVWRVLKRTYRLIFSLAKHFIYKCMPLCLLL